MRYQESTCTVELSVRELCGMALREPDLDAGGRISFAALREGSEVHRKLQKERDATYRAEESLSATLSYDGIFYTVSGRADGVMRTERGFCVEEIKSVRGRAFFAPPRPVAVAQLKCYALLLALREGCDRIDGQLTFFSVDTEKTKKYFYSFQKEDLKQEILSLLDTISWRAKELIKRVTERLPAATQARFPYPELREGQEIMIRESFSAIRRGKRLFVEAPTGTGKTVSSLFPAVRALGAGYVDKIFYLTPKASTRREAYRAAAKLHEGGATMRTVVITAKEQVCMCGAKLAAGADGKNYCNARDCGYAAGYYERVEKALQHLLSTGNGYPRNRICEVAKQYGVCPYELSLDLSELCDIIICDYNYAFDPSVYFRRYFSDDGERGRYVFLVDEAHDLSERARDMYSARLCRSDFQAFLSDVSEIEPHNEELVEMCNGVLCVFERMPTLCRDNLVKDADGNDRGFYMSRSPLREVNSELEIFRKKGDGWMRKHEAHPLADSFDRLLGLVRKYITVNEYFDDGFLCYVEISGGDISVKTYCLNPSPIMDALLSRAHASVLFSATMTPSDYFRNVLGGHKKSAAVSLPSPFASENLCVAVADYVSARFEDRQKNAARFATVIAATVSANPGNYIAYFPSYSCMESVLSVFSRKYPKVEIVVQKQGMSIREKEEFLSAFREDAGHLRVGFCVLGGAFAEGVDLPGSRLIGSVIFGVGLPGLSNERNMIQEYFETEQNGMGYDYAYTFPGMNNVLQAAGRVIRRAEDRGVVVLVDDRYVTPKYRALFPEHWQNIQYAGNAQSLAEIMRRFWKKPL